MVRCARLLPADVQTIACTVLSTYTLLILGRLFCLNLPYATRRGHVRNEHGGLLRHNIITKTCSTMSGGSCLFCRTCARALRVARPPTANLGDHPFSMATYRSFGLEHGRHLKRCGKSRMWQGRSPLYLDATPLTAPTTVGLGSKTRSTIPPSETPSSSHLANKSLLSFGFTVLSRVPTVM